MKQDDIFNFPKHMAIRPLNLTDVEQCVELENIGFPLNERCSKEKLIYRLTVCPELSSGIFIREFDDRYNASKKDEYQHELDELPEKSTITKETLIGHLIATKIHGPKITDESMGIPELTSENLPKDHDNKIGHVEKSSYIGIHSLVIHPDWRGKKLGNLLLGDYIQKLSTQYIGDSIAIIAKKELVPFYVKNNFTDHGESACKYGGETWNDLSIQLVANEDDGY